jgi:hypothetical protein
MDSLLLRALGAVGLFVGGLNFAGLGIYLSGADTPDDPVWPIILELYRFELGVLCLVVSVFLLWAIWALVTSILNVWQRKRQKDLPAPQSNEEPASEVKSIAKVRLPSQ